MVSLLAFMAPTASCHNGKGKTRGDPEVEELPLGKRLAEALRRAGLTQQELAARLGLDHSSVSRWLSGRRYPDIRFLPAIAEMAGVSVDYLLGLDGAPPPGEPPPRTDLASVVLGDWNWEGRRVAPDTRRRVRGVLWFMLARPDDIRAAGKDDQSENATRRGVEVLFAGHRPPRPVREGIRRGGGSLGHGDDLG
jgi:transcriptional regulator with XRE-family HTH domain